MLDNTRTMIIEVLADPDTVAQRAAEFIAGQARDAVKARGRFLMAVSGGHTPWLMLRLLADEDLPWRFIHLFQVDERVAPAGDRQRNLTHIEECLRGRVGLSAGNLHAMPVDDPDLVAAATRYGRELANVAGKPPVLDLVHLGLGVDGHTASLIPGDPALDVAHNYVTLSGPYQAVRRMTLTFPVLTGARCVLWVVTGHQKAAMLARLDAADRSIPAGRVGRTRALVLADTAAAMQLQP